MAQQTTAKQKQNKGRLRYVLLCIGSFLCSVGPLVGIFIWRREVYFQTVTEVAKLSIGAMIGVVLLIMKIVGKLKMPRRVVFYAVVFVMSILFEAVLMDLTLLSGAALCGEAIDYIFFQRAIAAAKEQRVVDKTAQATAQAVQDALQSYMNAGGRT